MTIYDNIKRLCDEKGLSIARVERRAGLGNRVIAGWKKSSPRIESLKRVADVLEVSINELII